MSAPENPLAFPFQVNHGHEQGEPSYGMTLRDWFAGHAMIAFAKYGPAGHAPGHLIAAAAYEAADAMLAERSASLARGTQQ